MIANEASNTISVLRNTATSGSITGSSFGTKIDFTTGTAPEGIAIGDLDGDGIPDIAVCNISATSLSLIKNVGLLYPPTITSVNPMIGYPASSVTITGADFNPVAADNIVYFGATQAVVTAATTTALTVTVPTGATYMPVSVLNTTAQQAAYSKYGFLSSYNNSTYISGILNFGTRVDFTTGSSPFDMAVADLDGDGKPDLVVANYSSNTVSVYHNTSTTGSLVAGSFAAKVDFNTGSAPRGVTIGDVDGDGKPDIVVANYSSNTVSVFRNTATSGIIASSSFATKVDFTTSANPISVSINDIDGDGKPDLVVANSNASSISILRNTSAAGSITTASFSSRVDFTTASSPWHVNTGDLDGDGKPEIVVANSGASSVSVFHNIATPGNITTGSLAAKTDFTTGTTPYRVAIADIDGDGKPDLAVTN